MARDLSLSLPLFHGGARSLKKTALGALHGGLGGRMRHDRPGKAVVEVLRNISLAINAGERVGLMGGNGAGKTSLLRVFGGIYTPTGGSLAVQGQRHALLHPAQAMQPDLTGRENIRLGGLYHGLSGAALDRLEADVAAFAALDEFLDAPVRIYSAGMAVRLGFGIATAIRPQILLLDEWFLAGDAAFMATAQARLEAWVQRAEILVLATHQEAVLRAWCTRVIWLERGGVRADGAPGEVIDAYRAISAPAAAAD